MDLKDILEHYRTSNNLTFRDLQEKTSLSYSYLNKIIRGESQPSKDKVQLIADELEMSRYRLLLSAGYYVDLHKDLKVNDLKWSDEELREQLKKYNIISLPHLSSQLTEKNFTLELFSKMSKISVERLAEIIIDAKVTSYDEAKDICVFLDVRFYQAFEVRKNNFDFKNIGVRGEEDVAFQIDRYIEKAKYGIKYENDSDFNKLLHYDTSFLLQKYEHMHNIKTIDELEFLVESLAVYRRTKYKYLTKE